MPSTGRWAAISVGCALAIAACSPVTDTSRTTDARSDDRIQRTIDEYVDLPARRARLTARERRAVANSALPPRHLDATAFPISLVDRELIVAGGPPPNGIPAIEEPVFTPASDVDDLAPEEAVLVLDHAGPAQAYPVRILIWHEIVNAMIGDVPIAVTYCPLCNSGIAFDRRAGGDVLDFRTSGALYQANLVMYDRQTESLWTQFDGRAVIGERVGERLEPLPMSMRAWRDFLESHPDGLVLTDDTGFDRPYGRNPYVSYENRDDPVGGYFTGDADPTLPAYERVVGVEIDGSALAVRRSQLARWIAVSARLDETPITIWFSDGMASPLSGPDVGGGASIGAATVFVSEVGGAAATFRSADDDTFVDDVTGSVWTFTGTAIAGPAAGEQLVPLPHVDTFWFSWATFYPDGELHEP